MHVTLLSYFVKYQIPTYWLDILLTEAILMNFDNYNRKQSLDHRPQALCPEVGDDVISLDNY